ncbi:uncharacterized protein TNCV_3629671 [Trichonephila clavipes]|nr:uncharacterized protein TNCV_3629671 [Trichonephila clavipes]
MGKTRMISGKKIVIKTLQHLLQNYLSFQTSRKYFVSKEGSSNGNTFPNRHIYYEPPEEFEFDPTSFLLPNTAGEVIVHRLPTSPDKKPDNNTPPTNPLKECSLPSDTPSSELSTNNTSYPKEPTSDKEQQRAYTKEEFTCAILARTQNEEHRKSCPALSPSVLDEDQIAVVVLASSMGESGVASMVRDSLTTNGQSLMAGDGRETCDCERRCSNPKHSHECKSGDYGVSPILERRNKGVLGRLRNFAVSLLAYKLCSRSSQVIMVINSWPALLLTNQGAIEDCGHGSLVVRVASSRNIEMPL